MPDSSKHGTIESTMPGKRKRIFEHHDSPPATHKRPRHPVASDLLTPLSDELLVRILSFLPLHDLLNIAPVSTRFYHLSGDSQIWKRLYYSQFVLPRALRLPGFRNGAARDGKLQYSSRRTIWADGRKGGWVDMHMGDSKQVLNWKRQYKLRHNWARGKCEVEELPLGGESRNLPASNSPKMHVKVLEGIAVTADAATGLRAWDLKTKQLVAQAQLEDTGCRASPSCMALDGQLLQENSIDIAVGFGDGSFGTWRLHIERGEIIPIYRHEGSSNGEIISISFLHPYIITATSSILISLYTFERPPSSKHRLQLEEAGADREIQGGADEEATQETGRENEVEVPSPEQNASDGEEPPDTGDKSKTKPPAPYLLTSLKSHTSRAPLALSLRKTTGSTVASIAYTYFTIRRGWSLGIQELHIRQVKSRSSSYPEITTTQLAYTMAVYEPPRQIPTSYLSPSNQSHSAVPPEENNQFNGPIGLSYSHPYLLATLPDNTLILYLCTSSASSLAISPGIRLWGHTSGISDAEITARGKAVSVSCRGEEIRVWELEGRTNGLSIQVRPASKMPGDDATTEMAFPEQQWSDRRNWVGFDDEMVIVLKESSEGRESLLVYDFT